MRVFNVHDVLAETRKERDQLAAKLWGINNYCCEHAIGELGASASEALIAHCNALAGRAEAAEMFIEALAAEIGAGATLAEVVDRVAQWLDADHGARLADVRGESGRAGFVAGYDKCWRESYGTKPNTDSVDEYADSYAAKVRGGGA